MKSMLDNVKIYKVFLNRLVAVQGGGPSYMPNEKREKNAQQLLRNVRLRLRKPQRELVAVGGAVKHFAVVSSSWEWWVLQRPECRK